MELGDEELSCLEGCPYRGVPLLTAIQGYGTNFYGLDEYYEGEWCCGQRSGWGRMFYVDGSVYEGEWFGDKRTGKGLLRLCE